jgi:hypothetical protein
VMKNSHCSTVPQLLHLSKSLSGIVSTSWVRILQNQIQCLRSWEGQLCKPKNWSEFKVYLGVLLQGILGALAMLVQRVSVGLYIFEFGKRPTEATPKYDVSPRVGMTFQPHIVYHGYLLWRLLLVV